MTLYQVSFVCLFLFFLQNGRHFESPILSVFQLCRFNLCSQNVAACHNALFAFVDFLQVKSRVAFGKPLVQQGTILQDIAESRIEIEQAR